MSREAVGKMKARMYKHAVKYGGLPSGEQQRKMERKAIEVAERHDQRTKQKNR